MSPENTGKARPGGGPPADSGVEMKDSRRPNPCSRPDLAAHLADWDAVQPGVRDELVEHVRTCPSCAPRWALLQEAEAWLESAAAAGPGSGKAACPSAELLYDHGAGPGHRPLAAEVRLGIEAHVERCAECRDLLATLASPPPLPLVLDESPGDESFGEEAPARTPAARPRWRLLPRAWRGFRDGSPAVRAIPLAAALLLITYVFVADRPWQSSTSAAGGGEALGLPAAPVLRGRAESPLLFPRGPVLASAAAPTGLAHPLHFEVEPSGEAADREATTAYRFVLTSNDGSAFDEGELVAELESPTSELVASDLALEPGHYTWEAWRTTRGLELRLGARDFEVVDDAAALAALEAHSEEAEPRRTALRLRDLHEAGYLTDARALALSLPPSEERDAYLESFPAR